MTYSIAFHNSGDEILFNPVNQELLDFYIGHLDKQNLNSFFPQDTDIGKSILLQINRITGCVLQVNQWLKDLADFEFEVCDDFGYLDQRVLNKLHADWVRLQTQIYDIQKKRIQLNFSETAEKIHNMFPDDVQTPPLAVVLDKLGLSGIYNPLNVPHIHGLEASFNHIKFTVSESWTKISENPFDKKLLTNDQANLSISFNHLGRTLYDKFCNFDTNLEFDDENSFDELLGYVTLSLRPSQTVAYSLEYTAWCHKHSREPIGDNLNIGNIPNLCDKLSEYRIIVLRNLLAKNKFSIRKG